MQDPDDVPDVLAGVMDPSNLSEAPHPVPASLPGNAPWPPHLPEPEKQDAQNERSCRPLPRPVGLRLVLENLVTFLAPVSLHSDRIAIIKHLATNPCFQGTRFPQGQQGLLLLILRGLSDSGSLSGGTNWIILALRVLGAGNRQSTLPFCFKGEHFFYILSLK